MSAGNGYRKPQLMRELDVDYWLDLSVNDLEHLMSPFFEEDIRVFAAILRCSHCYPHKCRGAIRPRLRGGTFEDWAARLQDRIYKRRPMAKNELADEEAELDDNGNPVWLNVGEHAGQVRRDRTVSVSSGLCLMLGMKQPNVSRGIESARAKGLLKPGFPFYIESKPSVVPPDETDLGDISTDITPESVQWLEGVRTRYLEGLSALRNAVRTELREGCTARGIFLSNKKNFKNRERGGEAPPPAAAPPSTPPASPPPPPSAPPPPAASTAAPSGNGTAAAPAIELAVSDPQVRESNLLYDQWRALREGCQKPVTIEINPECYRLFMSYPLPTQRRIVDDTRIRLPSWKKENLSFIPSAIEYLTKKKWATDPVKDPPPQLSKRDELAARVLDRIRERGL